MRIEVINKYTDNSNWYYDVNLLDDSDKYIDRYSGVIFNKEPSKEEIEVRCVDMFNSMNINITEDNIEFK
jgi:hypothetical protein